MVAERVEVEGYAEQRARQRPEGTPRPDLGRPGGGMHHVEPQLGDQSDGLGPARQHRLGADVDLDPADRAEPQLAADVGRALQDQDRHPGPAQLAGGREPGDAATDHHYVGSRVGHAGHSATRHQAPRRGVGPPSGRAVRPMLGRCPARRSSYRRCCSSPPSSSAPSPSSATRATPRRSSSSSGCRGSCSRLRVPRLLPYGELVLAAFLLLSPGGWYVVATTATLLLFAAYFLVILRAVRLPYPVSCSCFGRLGLGEVTGWTLARNGVLLALAAGHLGRLLARRGGRPAAGRPRRAGPGGWPASPSRRSPWRSWSA